MARRKLEDVLENALRSRDVKISQVGSEGAHVERPIELGTCKQCLELRPEADDSVVMIDEQRLDAEPVTDKRKLAPTHIPNCHREHAYKPPRRSFDSPTLERRKNDF